MSTSYVSDTTMSETQLIKAMAELGYTKDTSAKDTTDESYSITDGESFVWITIIGGNVANFTIYGRSNDDIIYSIADEVGVGIFSEHDEGFHETLDADENNCGMISLNVEDLMGGRFVQ